MIAALLRQSGEVEASAEVTADMNELVKAPELTKAVQKMVKQLQKVMIDRVVFCFLTSHFAKYVKYTMKTYGTTWSLNRFR